MICLFIYYNKDFFSCSASAEGGLVLYTGLDDNASGSNLFEFKRAIYNLNRPEGKTS